jgi:hypothetical protein
MKLHLAGIAALTMVAGGFFGTPASAAGNVIYVPDDFNPALSDTRATGHVEVVGSALHAYTTPNTALPGDPSTNKVAEYVDTMEPLAGVGEPSLEQTYNSGSTIAPGFQLVVDFNGDGTDDGILVGEPTAPGYGNNWWLNNSAQPFVKAGAPHTGGGFGSPNYGTLDEWRASFPNANVVAFGFALGSGVTGDWTINAITFAGNRYTFATHTVLTSKDQCKNGGWATSTKPVFKNQGECVSSFTPVK